MKPLDQLATELHGNLIRPGDSSYETARAVLNAMHDCRPAAIVRCRDAGDVIAAVRAARELDVDLAVRGGAHSVPGFGTCDGGVVADLSPLGNVHVDPANRRAQVGGGALWGDFDHAAGAFGLATTGGLISTTGVAGLTLGGGMGHLTRGLGLTCDNLLAADVVTADGKLITASDYQHEDLFWALRGGGGNFGVVTRMEFALHPVDTVVGGPVLYEYEDAAKVMAFFREFIDEAPEMLGCFFGWQIAPPLPFVPEDRVGDLFAVLVVCWAGPPQEADAVLQPIYDVAKVAAQHVGAMPYWTFNRALDALAPPGLQNYWKADFVDELTDDAISAHVAHGRRTPNVTSSMHLYPINGAVHRVGAEETAFGHRNEKFVVNIIGAWPDRADNEANTGWVRDYYAAIHPYSGGAAGYVNFMAGDDAGRVAANYGPNYARLAQVKAAYDADNVFHLNQNIAPAG